MNSDLASRTREVLLNGKWIANTNFKEQISDINWKQATEKIASLNSIAQLTFHVNYYLKGILQVFLGGTLEIKDQYSFDMPKISSEEDWQKLVTDFIFTAEKYIAQIELMNDQKLKQTFVKEAYGSYARNIEAQIEHCYYHLGQVSLIKKMILNKS